MDEEIETDVVTAEPGDVIHVTEPDAEIHDDDSVEIFDHSLDDHTDESVNVFVNVETPETETNSEDTPLWARELHTKLDQVLALQVVDALEDNDESSEDIEEELEAEEPTEVIEVEETKTEPQEEITEETSRRPKRRFGR